MGPSPRKWLISPSRTTLIRKIREVQPLRRHRRHDAFAHCGGSSFRYGGSLSCVDTAFSSSPLHARSAGSSTHQQLLQRIHIAPFPDLNAALLLLERTLCEGGEPAVVSRLLEVLRGNACLLDSARCAGLMRRLLPVAHGFEEGEGDRVPARKAPQVQQDSRAMPPAGAATADGCREPSSGPADRPRASPAFLHWKEQLFPLERTLFLCVATRLQLQLSPTAGVSTVHSDAADSHSGASASESRYRRVTRHSFAVHSLPKQCATLLRFAEQVSFMADTEPLVERVATGVAHEALRVYFGAARAETSIPRAQPLQSPSQLKMDSKTVLAAGGGHFRGGRELVARDACGSADPLRAALEEAWVWWTLYVRCAPLIPTAVAADISARAWASLRAVTQAAQHLALLREARKNGCAGPRAAAGAEAARTETLGLFAEWLEQLPALQDCHGGVAAGSTAASDGSEGSGVLAAVLVEMVEAVLHGVFPSDSEHRRHDSENATRRHCAAVRVLHRLTYHICAAASSSGRGSETAALASPVVAAAEQVGIIVSGEDSLRGRVSSLIRRYVLPGVAGSSPPPLLPVSRVERGERVWLETSALLEWYCSNHYPSRRTANYSGGTERGQGLDWMVGQAKTHLLSSALCDLAAVEKQRTAAAVSATPTALSGAFSEREDERPVGVPDGVPSLPFLLRYVQCWQCWLPSLEESQVASLTHALLQPPAEQASGAPLAGLSVWRGGSTRTPGPFAGAAGQSRHHGGFLRLHEQLLLRSYDQCVADASADHVSPLFTLFSAAQLALLLARANDPLRGGLTPPPPPHFRALSETPVQCVDEVGSVGDCANAATTADKGKGRDGCLLPSTPVPTTAAAVVRTTERGAVIATRPLLSPGPLRRLLHQCLAVFPRLRNAPDLHHDPARADPPRRRGRAASQFLSWGRGCDAMDGGSGAALLVPMDGEWARPAEGPAVPLASFVDEASRRRHDKRFWGIRYLPSIVALWSALGGASPAFDLVVRAPETKIASTAAPCAAPSQQPLPGVHGVLHRRPFYPASVEGLWGDRWQQKFIASTRQDLRGLLPEVMWAYPRLVATALHESCTAAGVSSALLARGIPPAPLSASSSPPSATSSLFLLSVLGTPVGDGRGGTAATSFTSFFVWQSAQGRELPRSLPLTEAERCESLTATCRGDAALGVEHAPYADYVEETVPSLQPFVTELLRSEVSAAMAGAAGGVVVDATPLQLLRLSVARCQAHYALQLLEFHSLCYLSDAAATAATAAHGGRASRRLDEDVPDEEGESIRPRGSVRDGPFRALALGLEQGYRSVVMEGPLACRDVEWAPRQSGDHSAAHATAAPPNSVAARPHRTGATGVAEVGYKQRRQSLRRLPQARPDGPSPVLSRSDSEVDRQALWRCLLALHRGFQAVVSEDQDEGVGGGAAENHQRVHPRGGSRGSLERRRAALQAGRAGSSISPYHQLVQEEVLRRVLLSGQPEPPLLAQTATIPFVKALLHLRANMSLTRSADGPALALNLFPPLLARRALHVLFLSPASTFAVVAPSLLLQLWNVAAGEKGGGPSEMGPLWPPSPTPTGGAGAPSLQPYCTALLHHHGGLVGEGSQHTSAASSAAVVLSPEELDALISWRVLLDLANRLDRIRREACSFVLATTATGNDPLDRSAADDADAWSVAAASVFAEAACPFSTLDDLAGALHEQLEADDGGGTVYGHDNSRNGSTDDDAMDGDEDDPASLFSKESVRLMEVLNRPENYHVDMVYKALRVALDDHRSSCKVQGTRSHREVV